MNAALKARFNPDSWFSIPDVTLVEMDAVRHDSRPKVAYTTAPRPACGERTKVRGLVDPLSETALVSKIVLRESRFQRWWFFGTTNPGALPQASNETAPSAQHNSGASPQDSLAAFAEPQLCRLQISPLASVGLLHSEFLLSDRKARDRIGRWRA
jgi:hypothetical protein